MNTTEQLYKVIAKALDISTEIITDQLEYQSIVEWDSMSHLILVEALETAYNIEIETEDILEMSTVAKLKDVLKKKNIEMI
ncbi:acyl carrier protein [Flavivirga aquimarina]|uniref:Acyl carrier protein n=1 Tax=Flavivirga aquimarina TaxID=2027862 RepID=A0ABT8WC28_9FLAO|nr:acyl carrier protein [Flavivirga aquimarina]MDO5970708.1 acyl carrier protein [Flavivirga aquimarina]